MVYYNLGVAGLLMMCFAIPTFFIFSTGQDGSHFSMNTLSWICIGIAITAISFMIYSYLVAQKLIKQQSKPGVEHE